MLRYIWTTIRWKPHVEKLGGSRFTGPKRLKITKIETFRDISRNVGGLMLFKIEYDGNTGLVFCFKRYAFKVSHFRVFHWRRGLKNLIFRPSKFVISELINGFVLASSEKFFLLVLVFKFWSGVLQVTEVAVLHFSGAYGSLCWSVRLLFKLQRTAH